MQTCEKCKLASSTSSPVSSINRYDNDKSSTVVEKHLDVRCVMCNNVTTLAPGPNGEAHILCVYIGMYSGIWLGTLRTASTQLSKGMVVCVGIGRIIIGLARWTGKHDTVCTKFVHVYHLDTLPYRIYEERTTHSNTYVQHIYTVICIGYIRIINNHPIYLQCRFVYPVFHIITLGFALGLPKGSVTTLRREVGREDSGRAFAASFRKSVRILVQAKNYLKMNVMFRRMTLKLRTESPGRGSFIFLGFEAKALFTIIFE